MLLGLGCSLVQLSQAKSNWTLKSVTFFNVHLIPRKVETQKCNKKTKFITGDWNSLLIPYRNWNVHEQFNHGEICKEISHLKIELVTDGWITDLLCSFSSSIHLENYSSAQWKITGTDSFSFLLDRRIDNMKYDGWRNHLKYSESGLWHVTQKMWGLRNQ